jgi:raffinose/stachyose/melibiose transport system permease protein
MLNSLKPARRSSQNPLALPERSAMGQFRPRLEGCAVGRRRFINSGDRVTALTIVLVCSTCSLAAYVLAPQEDQILEDGHLLSAGDDHAADPALSLPALFRLRQARADQQRFRVSLSTPHLQPLRRSCCCAPISSRCPKEIEEAAIVDGANAWQVFWRVMLPIVSPGILTVALIIGLNSWNEFLISSTFLQKPRQADRRRAFYRSGQYSSDWGEIMAAALLIVAPSSLFVFMQRASSRAWPAARSKAEPFQSNTGVNNELPNDYLERVYAGVLGKLIGVYLGRPFEGWTYQKIMKELGPIEYYVHDRLNQPLVVTDDDVAGTFTFVRALEDYGVTPDLSARRSARPG